jgi:hypothetical protein
MAFKRKWIFIATSLVDVLFQNLLVRRNFHADVYNQISSLFPVIWKFGQHFSTERIALAISCVEFLKGQVKVSDVFALVPPLPCFMWGMRAQGTGRVGTGRICMCVGPKSQSQTLDYNPRYSNQPSISWYTNLFCLFQQIVAGPVMFT